ncbi:MAG TPA: COX15/CtaA family protein [Thermoanaerobaculia bacterium]|nr:COX15/CtaA family protein [Thermoanaerobaculia bacterium]
MPEKAFAPAAGGSNAGLHRFAVLTAAATFLLVIAGGLVTSTESGLSVPDWPTTYGYNMFTFPLSKWVGGIRFEHSHRLIASVVGMLTIVLAFWIQIRESRRWVRALGWSALGAVVAQGVLGGLTVLLLLPPAISVAHACLAQTYFCLIVTLAVVTSPRWKDRAPRSFAAAFAANPVARIAAVTAGLVYLQLLVGAIMRHIKAGLAIPDFPLALGRLVPPLDRFPVAIHYAHRVNALAIAVAVAFLVVRARRSHRAGLARGAVWLAVLVAVQIGLGAATVLSRKDVLVATAHVACGALTLGATLAFGISALALEMRRGNVIPMRPSLSGRVAGWR